MGGKSVEKITEMLFSWRMPVSAFLVTSCHLGGTSPLQAAPHEGPTIVIIIGSYLSQEGIWFYLGTSLYCWCCTVNQCFAQY